MLSIPFGVRRGWILVLVGLVVGALLPAAAGAAGSKWRSYSETQQVPLEAGAAASILQVRTPPEDAPNASDVEDCMAQPGATTERGHVRSRFLWCLRSTAFLVQGNGGGEARIHYDIVGYGRDDGVRNVRLFFRVRRVEAVGSQPPPPQTMWRVRFECEAEDLDCSTSGTVSQSLVEWDLSEPDDWFTFVVSSRETGEPEGDNVAFHNFRLRSSATGFDDAVLPFQRIRCDSAEYFQIFGVRRPAACIFHNVVPYITYSLFDSRVSQIAAHIWLAQRFPTITYPLKPGLAPKSIPGAYPGPDGGGNGLTRIRRGTTTRANRAEVRLACNRLAPYDQTGLPRPPAAGQHCDEYPFASTLEGAASSRWDFSVRAVDATQNCSAGGLLNYYLTTDRILYDQDEYFVRIAGGSPPQNPPIFDPPNDGDDCTPDDGEVPTVTR
jgi:Deoxyribonuclease NucA/NucB